MVCYSVTDRKFEMFFIILLCILIAALIGLGARQIFRYQKSDYQITWLEYAIGLAVCALVLFPLTSFLGYKVAKANKVSYNEFWNGVETQAVWDKVGCSRDSGCRYDYNCDPYEVTIYHSAVGKVPAYTTTETHYHSCPYATEEWSFTVKTTLGDYSIASGNLPDNPESYRSKPIPGNIPRGVPDFWAQAKARLDAGTPGPVTVRKQYDNYILASTNNIIKKHSTDIRTYVDAKLFPPPVKDIRDFYYANKFYPVGVAVAGDWQFAVNRFNAALGGNLQGDLHFVLVDANKVTNADSYAIALGAYWQSPTFGKDDISKNSIIVVAGTTDGTTIAWARAQTGMPVGNEALMLDIQNSLKGAPLDPAVIFGNPVAKAVDVNGKTKIQVTNGNGLLEKAVWGEHKFARVCMTCKDEHNVGYNYLKSEIQPSTGQKVWIVVLSIFESLIIWGLFLAIGKPTPKITRNKRDRRSNRYYDDEYTIPSRRR